jgi:hypothetical protein
MNDKATFKRILEKILEIYNSSDETRKSDFFEKELPNFIASEDFTYNPAQNDKDNDKEGE